jgi:nucleoid-associated protein YgaU
LELPKNKFDLLWLGFSLGLVIIGGFFIVTGIWGIIVRNSGPVTSVNQIDINTTPTSSITVNTTTNPGTNGQVGDGIATVRSSSETVAGVSKSNQTNQFIEQTGKWTATDYKSGEINKGNYYVKRGDTLWEIAEAVYGNGKQWTKILNANKSKIRKLRNGQQALIVPGQVLKIP